MIQYTITALDEWRIDSNGLQSNATMTGYAATLPAAKRKARADAEDYRNKAEIDYYSNNGEPLYKERNDYGIRGDWKNT